VLTSECTADVLTLLRGKLASASVTVIYIFRPRAEERPDKKNYSEIRKKAVNKSITLDIK
jgi:hypothetical protein